jgi:hypothetical protein
MTDEVAEAAVGVAVALVADAPLPKGSFLKKLEGVLAAQFGEGFGELQAQEVLARARFDGRLEVNSQLHVGVPEKPRYSFGVLLTAEELEYAVGASEEVLDASFGRMTAGDFYNAMIERFGGAKYGIYVDQVSQVLRRGEVLDRLVVSSDLHVERVGFDRAAWVEWRAAGGSASVD